MSRAQASRGNAKRPWATAADLALEATVIGGHTTIGFNARRTLDHWESATPVDLTGRTFLITGATSGIGHHGALALSSAGARVLSASRSAAHIRDAMDAFSDAGVADRVQVSEADLTRPGDITRFCRQLRDEAPQLDGIAHCAGAFFARLEHTPEGVESNTAIYVLGPQQLTLELAEHLARAPDPRVVWVSSSGAYARRLDLGALDPAPSQYRPLAAYAHAKRAQIALTHAWSAQYPDIASDAMTPGWTDTDLVRQGLPRFRKTFGPILRNPKQGADTLVWLLSRPRTADFRTNRLWRDRRPRLEHRTPLTLRGDTPDDIWRWCEARLEAVRPGDPPVNPHPRGLPRRLPG